MISQYAYQQPRKHHKEIFIALAIISIIVIGIIAVDLTTFSGQFNPNVSWSQEEGDVYYLGLQDRYEGTGEYEKYFRTILKSEILNTTDLAMDWDEDPDLTIMSSILAGKEDVYSIEFPNYFDLYQGLLGLNNIMKVIGGASSVYEYQTLADWALPSAMHFQTSTIYKYLNSILEEYNIFNLSSQYFAHKDEFDSIEDLPLRMATILAFFTSLTNDFSDYSDDFEGATLNFTLSTMFPDNNSISLAPDPENPENQMMCLSQDHNASVKAVDDLIASYDIFENWIKKTGMGARIQNIDEYVYTPRSFNVYVDREGNKDGHQLYLRLITDRFSISAERYGTFEDFSGFNGINLRIHNGMLQYSIGKYGYLGDSYEMKIRESLPSERGWNDLVNVSTSFVDGNFTIQVDIKDSYLTFDIIISNNYAFQQFSDIPIHFDCPFDFYSGSCYDYNRGENRLFRAWNFTNVEFEINNTHDPKIDSVNYIDNIITTGQIYWGYEDLNVLYGDLFTSSIFLLSFYHMLFYPNNFPFETIVGLCAVINDLVPLLKELLSLQFGINLENFNSIFDVTYVVNDTLKIEISENTMDALIIVLNTLIQEGLKVYNIFSIIEGDYKIKMKIEWDIGAGVLKESTIFLNYTDIGYCRSIGVVLLAAQKGDIDYQYLHERIDELEARLNDLKLDPVNNSEEIKNIEAQIQELRDGMARIYEDYPAVPPSGWATGDDLDRIINEYASQAIFTLAIAVCIGAASSSAASITVAYLLIKRITKKASRITKKN